MSKPTKEDNEEKEIIQPTVSSRPRFLMEGGKSKLDHPRRELWKWLFSYIVPLKWKFISFLR